MSSEVLNKIQIDLHSLRNKYEVVLFGSQVSGGARPDSDYDVAVISRMKDAKANINLQKELIGKFSLIYDIRVFELYPIDIQISIIQNYVVIFGDILEISEYFYYFRKIWNDCKKRILDNQYTSYKERIAIKEKIKNLSQSRT
ncbi:nucleotidyltransferase domain-containing protein [Promethearchaeum syntrophicum]|uniref:Nucleotidyltransferase domain-containing protein n=1 Tax=Promethearchaeum syntrophicum TaxID=2594042 RepID=A0A5B9DER9_9ARCH|nr:nucleotidyltransferase domain-containing protein [Candidatus Prometheoarchaeum syntrophicum]QEE17602.1 Nucleotidyltransferase domain protein [Candidatus Prometheoarchaeum syntrophicum]